MRAGDAMALAVAHDPGEGRAGRQLEGDVLGDAPGADRDDARRGDVPGRARGELPVAGHEAAELDDAAGVGDAHRGSAPCAAALEADPGERRATPGIADEAARAAAGLEPVLAPASAVDGDALARVLGRRELEDVAAARHAIEREPALRVGDRASPRRAVDHADGDAGGRAAVGREHLTAQVRVLDRQLELLAARGVIGGASSSEIVRSASP